MSLRTSVILVILHLSLAGVAFGQDFCPYDESDAVADTLDPSGYYPLQVGNVWEYVRYTGPFLEHLRREEVMGDTLIDADVFYHFRRTILRPPHCHACY
ncbi:MAG TPA: hypothetical protein VKZ61_04535 [Thermomicrobiales bacterium]|nr:hypothetical protein [Thermomicrobiales bacterium]